jgi:hypothetical protein
MLRRTAPAVSFTTSHRALMYRANRPLLGKDMNSVERFKAAWDETPFTMLGMSRKEQNEWHWKAMYQLGLRDVNRWTKLRSISNWIFLFLFAYVGSQTFFAMFIYMPIVGGPSGMPDSWKREHSRESARARGSDVWAADGKFVRPYFHINPPMFTMTTDEL